MNPIFTADFFYFFYLKCVSCCKVHESADVLTVPLSFFVRQTAAKRCVKELKAKALSVRSTSSSGEGEGPSQSRGPPVPRMEFL